MSRGRVVLAVAVVSAVAVVAAVLAVVRGTRDGAGPLERATAGAYVALGDSYSAGLGAWDRVIDLATGGDGGPPCYRAKAGYPRLLLERYRFRRGGGSYACSGAVTSDFWDSREGRAAQESRVNDATSLITLSVGGNDVGFAEALRKCVVRFLQPDGCVDQDETIRGRFAPLRRDLRRVLSDLHHRAPRARVLVLGYPRIFPDRPVREVDFMSARDQQWINGIVRDLDELIRGVVRDVHDRRIEYVDVYGAFAGHEVTAPDPYMHRLTLDFRHLGEGIRRGYHPNAAGNRRLAELLGTRLSAAAPA